MFYLDRSHSAAIFNVYFTVGTFDLYGFYDTRMCVHRHSRSYYVLVHAHILHFQPTKNLYPLLHPKICTYFEESEVETCMVFLPIPEVDRCNIFSESIWQDVFTSVSMHFLRTHAQSNVKNCKLLIRKIDIHNPIRYSTII